MRLPRNGRLSYGNLPRSPKETAVEVSNIARLAGCPEIREDARWASGARVVITLCERAEIGHQPHGLPGHRRRFWCPAGDARRAGAERDHPPRARIAATADGAARRVTCCWSPVAMLRMVTVPADHSSDPTITVTGAPERLARASSLPSFRISNGVLVRSPA